MLNIFTDNNFPINLKEDDETLIIISKKLFNLSRLNNFIYDINSDLNLWEDFEFLFSLSYDSKSFNSWKSLKNFEGLELSQFSDSWVKVKITRLGSKRDLIEINNLDFDITLKPRIIPETSHTFDGIKGTKNFNPSDYIINNPHNMYDIYAMGDYYEVYKQLSNVVHDFTGIGVEYIKTVPDDSSVDHFFREYAINREFQVKDFKIVVPGNEFHSQYPAFNPFGADFSDIPWEVHIVKDKFEKTFGFDARPIRGDFLYLPLTNKLYMIDGVVLDRSFLEATGSFYKVSLVKYENQARIIKSEHTKDTLELATKGLKDLESKQMDEFNDVIKPREHDVILDSNNWVWQSFNNKVQISDKTLEKNYVIISKNYYDFSALGELEEAIVWKSSPSISNELSLTLWFNIQTISEIYPLFSYLSENEDCDSYGLSEGDGLFLNIKNDSITFTDNIGEDSTDYSLSVNIEKDNWYSVVVNINNTFDEISLFLWGTNLERNSRLTLLNKFTHKLCKRIVLEENSLPNWRALGGNYKMTNVKVMSKTISEENQSLFLTQYIVNDSKNIVFVDTARPILDKPKQSSDKSQMDKLRNNFK